MKKQELLKGLGFSEDFLKQLDEYSEPNEIQFEEVQEGEEIVDSVTTESTELKLSQKQASSNDFHYKS